MSDRLRVAVVGAGLIGRRRASAAAANPASRCVAVADVVPDAARAVASELGAEAVTDWRSLVDRRDVDVLVVATPNGLMEEIVLAALGAGKHVLMEKPMGRSVAEAERMRDAARRADRQLKVGFNHRYHPAIAEAHRRFVHGEIGPLINIRARYGHGGRPGYEREWRGNRELAGGGELTDQGVHIADLLHWFAGLPEQGVAFLQTAVWPLGDLEDNAFGLFRFRSGVVASLYTSWTQWKNLFSFEVYGERGALTIDGLGRSYGVETLTCHRRRLEGGAPETEVATFDGDDLSWAAEWADFLGAVQLGKSMLGTADDGVNVMRMIDALYRSAASGRIVPV